MATEIKSTSIKSQNIIAEPQTNKPGSPEAGQIIQATGTGDIAKGIYHYTGESFFSLDNAQGDLETLRLVLSTDTSAVDFNSALNSTSTLAGNTNAVPHETSTGTGLLGALEIPSTGGDALLTEFDANKVFRYFSAGANNNNDYFGIPIDIPAQTRGQNIVIKFKYRTEEASDTTSNGDFQVSVWDKTNGVKTTQDSTLTTGTTISAGSNILMTSKTNLSVGDKIWFETGGTGSTVGGVANSLTQAYITSISSTDNNITVSEDVQVIASGLAVTGWLSDKSTGLLPSADSDTNKVGKDFSIQVKTEEDTQQIVLYISNKSTTTNVIELFFDGILVSQNKFLQSSGQGLSESYKPTSFASFWKGTGTAAPYTFNTTNITPSGGSPPLAQSKLVQVADITGPGTYGTVTAIKAKQKITLDVAVTCNAQANSGVNVVDSTGVNIAANYETNAYWGNCVCSVVLEKNDYVFLKGENNNSAEGGVTFTATPEVSDTILLESQDEIYTDWVSDGTFQSHVSTDSGTAPTFGAVTTDKYFWRRDGSDMIIRVEYGQSTAGTAGTGTYLISLPSGYNADLSKITPYTAEATHTAQYLQPSSGMVGTFTGGTDTVGYFLVGNGILYSSTQIRVAVFGHGGPSSAWWSGPYGGGAFNSTTMGVTALFRVPIQGWSSNFNPLMSLPLVDIGSDVEQYLVNTWAGRAGNSVYSTGTPTINTLSGLGTITNSSTEGFFFTASQRCKVNFSYYMMSTGTPDIGLAGGSSTLDFYNNNFHSTHFNGYRLDAQAAQTATGYDGVSSEILLEPGQKVGIAWSDSTSAITSGANNGAAMIVATKDHSNTSMAHIIKPAVAIGKGMFANGTNEGSSGNGTYAQRKLNVWTGDTWFVSGFDGTLGPGGTTDQFDLDPGTYKIHGYTTAYKSNGSFSFLQSTDNSIEIYGGNGRPGNGEDVNVLLPFSRTITITEKKTFKLFTWTTTAQATYGLGVEIGTSTNAPADRLEQYSSITIEKLK